MDVDQSKQIIGEIFTYRMGVAVSVLAAEIPPSL